MAHVTTPPGVIVDLNPPVPTLTLPVNVSGADTLREQWLHDGAPLHDGGGVSGANTPTLTITGFSAANNGAYSCVVANAYGADTSDVAICAADHVSSVPLIALQPADQILDSRANVFGVRAFSSGPLTFQWTHDGVPLVDGALPDRAIVAGSQYRHRRLRPDDDAHGAAHVRCDLGGTGTGGRAGTQREPESGPRIGVARLRAPGRWAAAPGGVRRERAARGHARQRGARRGPARAGLAGRRRGPPRRALLRAPALWRSDGDIEFAPAADRGHRVAGARDPSRVRVRDQTPPAPGARP